MHNLHKLFVLTSKIAEGGWAGKMYIDEKKLWEGNQT